MRFWDSSAILPLCLTQPRSAEVREALRSDPELVVWWATRVECASAIARLERDGTLSARDVRQARTTLAAVAGAWYEVQPTDRVRQQAERLLRLHPLRAADALQLAAALEWAGLPVGTPFITFDQRLGEAAEREGFALR
jgi:predicted nucleic acid-binding protein